MQATPLSYGWVGYEKPGYDATVTLSYDFHVTNEHGHLGLILSFPLMPSSLQYSQDFCWVSADQVGETTKAMCWSRQATWMITFQPNPTFCGLTGVKIVHAFILHPNRAYANVLSLSPEKLHFSKKKKKNRPGKVCIMYTSLGINSFWLTRGNGF